MDAVNRASFCALAAVGALGRVDMGAVIFHCNRAKFAGALALFASDAAVGAHFAGIYTLILIHAGNIDLLASWQNFQDRIWANLCTGATADALVLVDLSNVVDNVDCIVFAHVGAVAIAQASKVAAGSAVIVKFCRLAVFRAVIIHDVIGGLQMAAAAHNCTLWLNLADRNAQDFAEFRCNRRSAYRAKIRRCFPSCHLGGILITTRAAAGAAVCARQHFTEVCYRFIYLYREKLGSNAQQKSRD